MSLANVITCVYCGQEYPEGTPPSGSEVLTEHIKICEKHPMRAAEEKIKKLRGGLVEIVGTDDVKELESMKLLLTMSTLGPHEPSTIRAINLLLEIREDE